MTRSSGRSTRAPAVIFAAGLVALVLILPAPAARAACGDYDLICQVQKLDSDLQITNTSIGSLNTAMGFLSTQVSTIATAMENVTEVFEELSQDLLKVVSIFKATMDTISDDTMTLTADVVQRIEDSRRLVDFFLQYERDQYLEFVTPNGCSARCEAFRGELVSLVGHIESSTNLGFEALMSQLLVESNQPLPPIPQLDLGDLQDLLQSAPGVVLYTVHRTFMVMAVAGEPPPGISACAPDDPTCAIAVLNNLFSKGEEAFEVVIALAEASTIAPVARQWGRASSAGFMHEQCVNRLVGTIGPTGISKQQAAEGASTLLIVFAGVMKSFGHALESFALSGLGEETGDVGGQVAAHVGAGFHSNKARTFGRAFAVIGAVMGEVGAFTERKVGECRTRLNNQITMCWLSVKNPIKGNNNQPGTYETCFARVANGETF